MQKLLVPLASAMLMVGCIGPNPYITPVEDRTQPPPPPPPAGTLVPAEPAEGVTVMPVFEVPAFSTGTDTAGSSDTLSPSERSIEAPSSTQSNGAVIALLGDARQSVNRGDLSSAESQVERALRISPRDPEVYLQLAQIKRRQGEYLQAEQVALRGVAVAAAQPAYKRTLWLEVAEIRTASGDLTGAQAARAQAQRY